MASYATGDDGVAKWCVGVEGDEGGGSPSGTPEKHLYRKPSNQMELLTCIEEVTFEQILRFEQNSVENHRRLRTKI